MDSGWLISSVIGFLLLVAVVGMVKPYLLRPGRLLLEFDSDNERLRRASYGGKRLTLLFTFWRRTEEHISQYADQIFKGSFPVIWGEGGLTVTFKVEASASTNNYVVFLAQQYGEKWRDHSISRELYGCFGDAMKGVTAEEFLGDPQKFLTTVESLYAVQKKKDAIAIRSFSIDKRMVVSHAIPIESNAGRTSRTPTEPSDISEGHGS